MYYYNFIDTNVDGCGTNVTATIKTDKKLLLDDVCDMRQALNAYKDETEDWDSDDIFEFAEKYLSNKGYNIRFITPTFDIVL